MIFLFYMPKCVRILLLFKYLFETECPSMASSQCTYVVSIFYNRFMCQEGKSRRVEFLHFPTFFQILYIQQKLQVNQLGKY